MTERSKDEVGPRARAPLAGRCGPPGRVKRGPAALPARAGALGPAWACDVSQ